MSQKSNGLRITVFEPKYQKQVEHLVIPIQTVEFGYDTSVDRQPDLQDVAGYFLKGKSNFWIALHEDTVIGTIGIVDIGNHQAVVKKMFVSSEFRGPEPGVARMLMNTSKQWCIENGMFDVMLGTTERMLAAQRFYEKHGFNEVALDDLPQTFPVVHGIDKVFYRCQLDPSANQIEPSPTNTRCF